MENNSVEQRLCRRFTIPGATVSYEYKKKIEEFSPLVDISRAGIKFQSNKPLDINTELALKISIPGETIPLILNGQVRWLSFDDKNEKYEIGVQFNPYGEKEGQNYPGNLVKIIALEQKFSTSFEPPTEKYEIDS